MNYQTVTASKPGAPAPKIEKRTGDSKVFWIDCTPLLTGMEQVYGTVEVKPVSGLEITGARTRRGKFLEFRLSGGPTNMPVIEYQVKFGVTTTMNNTMSVPVVVKVYSD